MECPLYKCPLYRDFLIRVWPGKRSVPRFTVRLIEMSALWCVRLIEIQLHFRTPVTISFQFDKFSIKLKKLVSLQLFWYFQIFSRFYIWNFDIRIAIKTFFDVMLRIYYNEDIESMGVKERKCRDHALKVQIFVFQKSRYARKLPLAIKLLPLVNQF